MSLIYLLYHVNILREIMIEKINIDFPKDNRISLIKYWLFLAISSLAASGIFPTSCYIKGAFFENKLPVEHIFATSLVVHVDLSVLVWFLSICSLLWCLLADKSILDI